MHSNWTLFKSLCRVIGGQDHSALTSAREAGILPQLVTMAATEDVLSALAMRMDEQPDIKLALPEPERQLLQQALHDNTRRNMQTVMQALKLSHTLNKAGITPTFLKGTAQLLTVNEARLGFRKQIDIDLVVAPNEIGTTCQALIAAGYGFYREAKSSDGKPDVHHDMAAANRESATHHHLPPLVIDGYGACVEVHRHFLPKRFQRKNPVAPLLDTAHQHHSHGATFKVPATEYQLIHSVLGKLVHDGYLASRSFPIREACDYIELLESEEGMINEELVTQHCGKDYALFSQLVAELMAYKARGTTGKTSDISRRMQVMQRRYSSPTVSTLLDVYARTIHLTNSLSHNPAKLGSYLQRLFHNG